MESLDPVLPWLVVALTSIGVVYLGYLHILSEREEPVSFNVPVPPEIRPDWVGRNWDDVQGEERKVLEGQVKGVSSVSSITASTQTRLILVFYLAMERKADHELLPCRRKDPGLGNHAGNA